MNILVISDSHRATEPIRQILKIYAGQVSMALHLGDHAQDLLRFQGAFPHIAMHAVAGNCDSGGEPEKLLTLHGRRILLTHGHRHQVKMSVDRLMYYAEEKEADACLFGHTHVPAVFDAGPVLFMNPGSIGQPRMGALPGYGLLRISELGVLKAVTLNLGRME